MNSNIRRVTTGQSLKGSSIFVGDDRVIPALHDGRLLWLVWGTDDFPMRLPSDGRSEHADTRFPPPHGARVLIAHFPGTKGLEPSITASTHRDVPQDGGRYASNDPDTGMHMTDTVDIVFVLKGEIGLEQDDGVEVLLTEGDVLIQNGARHAWRPREVECRLAFVILGAERT